MRNPLYPKVLLLIFIVVVWGPPCAYIIATPEFFLMKQMALPLVAMRTKVALAFAVIALVFLLWKRQSEVSKSWARALLVGALSYCIGLFSA